VKNLITLDAVTSSALGLGAGEVVVRPRCVAPLAKVKGTGLPVGGPVVPTFEGTGPFAAAMAATSYVGVVMGAVQAEQPVRIPVATVQGNPSRRPPHRC
jgi:hypothetical protein